MQKLIQNNVDEWMTLNAKIDTTTILMDRVKWADGFVSEVCTVKNAIQGWINMICRLLQDEIMDGYRHFAIGEWYEHVWDWTRKRQRLPKKTNNRTDMMTIILCKYYN